MFTRPMKCSQVWRRLGDPRFGLGDRISEAMAAHEWAEPDAYSDVRAGRETLLASDIGGDHADATFRAFGFLLAEIGSSREWMERRVVLRRASLHDGRRMSYKALRDRVRMAALPKFLDNASSLQGNLVVVLVSREIRDLFSDPGDARLLPELVIAERGWNPSAFARLLATGTFGALLTAGFVKPTQDILWLSDQDEIAPNAKLHNHTGHVLSHCIERYAPEHRGQFTFITTEGGFDHCFREDLVAIPDLAAGALVEACAKASDLAVAPTLWRWVDRRMSQKGQVVLRWLSSCGSKLRTTVVILRPNGADVQVKVLSPRWLGGDLHRLKEAFANQLLPGGPGCPYGDFRAQGFRRP